VNHVVRLLPRLRLAAAALEHGDLTRGDALVERTLQAALDAAHSFTGTTRLEAWLLKIMQEEHARALEASSRG
jgi:DNA-directed RNA polymerase specialized sigma24 family protein